jgi:hypothetical protein
MLMGVIIVIQTLVNNPSVAIITLVLALLLGKVFKISMKVLKWILLICIAYVIVSFIGIA